MTTVHTQKQYCQQTYDSCHYKVPCQMRQPAIKAFASKEKRIHSTNQYQTGRSVTPQLDHSAKVDVLCSVTGGLIGAAKTVPLQQLADRTAKCQICKIPGTQYAVVCKM
jgi:hypothetical protein